MATDLDIIITDMTGHSFTIKLNWDLRAMKDSISIHYDNKFKHEFCIEKGITKRDFITHTVEYYKSEYYKKVNAYCPDNIQLIYKGEVLEQYHVEADQFTLDDFKIIII